MAVNGERERLREGGTKTWKTRTPGVEHGAGTLKGPGRSVSFPQRLDDEPVTELERSGVGLGVELLLTDCSRFTRPGQETVDNEGGKKIL